MDSPKMNNKPAAASNYTPARKAGHKIQYVVVHTEQGTEKGTALWFANPAAHVSAHCGIALDGTIDRFVPDEAAAWHAGNWVYNQESLSVELEGDCDKPNFPSAMLDSLAKLISYWCAKYGIPKDRKHIIGHCEVPDQKPDHHHDPGTSFPWDDLMKRLNPEPVNVA